MNHSTLIPDYIFESSWEVCNKVGGIYTVLSTRAKTLQDAMPDHVIFIGPDFWQSQPNPLFVEDKRLWASWRKQAAAQGLQLRVGRWQIPGQPLVILVDFQPFFAQKDSIYGALWTDYQVDSLHAYGDYDEASMFSYAAGRVVESFYHAQLSERQRVVYQAHEWMTGLGALYIRKHVPAIGTIFTTHATSIGRSIAGNGKPLYDYLFAYNGNQMADELNMQSKHSIERQTAHHVDCFTTVSDVTARECVELLDKCPDVVLPNGFEMDFVPKGGGFASGRRKARTRMLQVANALTGVSFADDTLIVSLGGRYEWKNKGIDVYLEALSRLAQSDTLQRTVLAFVAVPGWQKGAREDLRQRMEANQLFDTPLPEPIVTHQLCEPGSDRVCGALHHFGLDNHAGSRVYVIFAPCYLDGTDGIFGLHYYEQLIGTDLSIYPSYYEPWGYTPLESVAFHVPCVTTSLSGFGMWAESQGCNKLASGVEVIHRTDYNYDEVVDAVRDAMLGYSKFTTEQTDAARRAAAQLARKAQWKHFITYYYQAYHIALTKAEARKEALA